MEGIIIRMANRGDCHQLMENILGLARFEQHLDQVLISEEDLVEYGFDSDPPYFHCFVAELDGKVIGHVLYYYLYSAYEGGQLLYLKDFFVREEHRKVGCGRLLFEALIEKAKSDGCFCVQWCVFSWNENAIRFYEKIGGINITEKDGVHVLRLSGDSLPKSV